MSEIKNENGIKMPILKGVVRRVREQLEHRAIWLAVLCDQAEQQGLSPESYAGDAIYRCGCMQGKTLSGGKTSFKVLNKNLFGFFARKVFEMKVRECTDDKLSIDFHYCPLVKAWQKMGYDDQKIQKLCDFAMCGDRGIIAQFGGELDLQQTIAQGKDHCKIRFVRPCGKKADTAESETTATESVKDGKDDTAL